MHATLDYRKEPPPYAVCEKQLQSFLSPHARRTTGKKRSNDLSNGPRKGPHDSPVDMVFRTVGRSTTAKKNGLVLVPLDGQF
jgi:hypothetical protein